MLLDRAVALFGLGVTLIIGLYTFAPDTWPKVPPMATAGGMAIGILILGIGGGLLIADYRGANKDDFDIEFDPADERFVDVGPLMIRYAIGLRNKSSRTIAWPSIRALNSLFTNQILNEVDPFNWGAPVGAMYIFVGGAIDPKAMELIPLFDLPVEDRFFARPEILSRRHHFTLEVRGRDVKTYSADFEYDPSTFPRLRKC
jgi:hypothetical protein